MFKKAFLIVTLAFAVTLVGHAQTVDIIVTKEGKNIFGEILENKSEKIEIKERGSEIVKKVLKSEIREVLIGFKYEDLSDTMIKELEAGIPEYDYIIRTNGDKLNVVILDVSPKRVTYKYPFESDDDVREIDRSLVAEIYQRAESIEESIKESKMEEQLQEVDEREDTKSAEVYSFNQEMDLEEKYMEDVIYTQNRMQMATFNFTAMGLGSLSFGYERAFGKNKSVEAIFSIHGAGLENQNVEKKGLGAEIGYKYKMGNIFSEYYLPDHLLSGTYFKPIIGFGTVNERIETYSGNNSFVFQNKNRNYGYVGFDLGYQWVFGDLISMDIYSGLAYYNGQFEIETNNNGDQFITEDNFFDEGDFFASDNFGAKAGFRIGFLFGSKSKYENK